MGGARNAFLKCSSAAVTRSFARSSWPYAWTCRSSYRLDLGQTCERSTIIGTARIRAAYATLHATSAHGEVEAEDVTVACRSNGEIVLKYVD